MSAISAATIALIAPAKANTVGPVFAGVCDDITLAVTYNFLDPLPLLPRTEIVLGGTADCVTDKATPGDLTETTILSGSGWTLDGAETFTCAGGVILGTGEVDIPSYVGFPHGEAEGHLLISVVGVVAQLTLVAQDGRVIGAGIFVQLPTHVSDCLAATEPDTFTTSWVGAFAFMVTDTGIVS